MNKRPALVSLQTMKKNTKRKSFLTTERSPLSHSLSRRQPNNISFVFLLQQRKSQSYDASFLRSEEIKNYSTFLLQKAPFDVNKNTGRRHKRRALPPSTHLKMRRTAEARKKTITEEKKISQLLGRVSTTTTNINNDRK